MRIGIDYRILTVGRYLVRRGMGRFTQQQLRAVLDAGHEYVLLCQADADLSLLDPVIAKAPDVSVQLAPTPSPEMPGSWLEADDRYLDWVSTLDLDLYHATTPFLCQEPVLVGFDACTVVATWYDAIPIVHPDQYLSDPCERECYVRSLGLVMGARRLLSISAASGDDAVRLLGRAPEEVDVAWPIPDPCFRPLTTERGERTLARLRQRIRLPHRYALSVTFPHHTKNLDTLLRGYALLAAEFRAHLPLVLVFEPGPAGRLAFTEKLIALGIEDDVVVTGLVSDSEAVGLYNAASVVVHPSRHEGFGLPVVEAMACGAPVVTTTASCLPEVAGGAALLVDPDDDEAFARAIGSVVDSPDLADDLRRRGLANASRFDAAQLRRATLGCYRKAVESPSVSAATAPQALLPGSTSTAGRQVRVAIWAPVPPVRSGVADNVAELIGGLRPTCEVEVFVDDGVIPETTSLWQGGVHHYSAFDRRQRLDPFDVSIYELGASSYHLYMQDTIRSHPGILVVHDLPWSYVLYAQAAARGDLDAFRVALAHDEGEDAARQFEALEREATAAGGLVGDSSTCEFWNRHPMLGPLVAASRAVIVHSPALARDVERLARGVPVHMVPLGVGDPRAITPEPDKLRAELGIAESGLVVGAFGIVHPAKRLEAVIEALPAVLSAHPDSRLIVVGSALDPSYVDLLVDLALRLGVAHALQFTGYVDRVTFDRWMAACDVVVALRQPSMHQTSVVVLRALAAGSPVMITETPFTDDVPIDASRRIPAGKGESQRLAAELNLLADDPVARQAMASSARSYFEQNGTISHMVSSYLEVVSSVIGHPVTARPMLPARGLAPAVLALAST